MSRGPVELRRGTEGALLGWLGVVQVWGQFNLAQGKLGGPWLW